MKANYSVSERCEALVVSRSGYHDWDHRVPGIRAQANTALLPLITQAHRESRQTYGSPRITRWLAGRGHRCSRVRIARLMRQAGSSHRSLTKTEIDADKLSAHTSFRHYMSKYEEAREREEIPMPMLK